MNKTYFAYTRVSTVKQGEGVSLEAQKEAIERYCAQHDLYIAEWFGEKETAAKQGRPIFTDVIKQLHSGKANGLIMHKIDRSARNLRDWATVGDLQDAGIDVHFAAESVDFASRGGRLTADIQAVIAADYIRNLREETIKGINGRLKQGLYPFKAPLGYLDNGGGMAKTICPVKGPKVAQVFEAYATGENSLWSLVDFAKDIGLTSHGQRTIGKTTIENLISNPFYVGLMQVKRKTALYQGCHEPLISKTLFDRVQSIRQGRIFKKVTKHDFTYRRVFSCADCGTAYIPERQKGHVYYRCHTKGCSGSSLREEALEAQVSTKMLNLELTGPLLVLLEKRMKEWADAILKTEYDCPIPMELAKLKHRRDQLLDAMLDGLINRETYEERCAQLLLQETGLSERHKKALDSEWFQGCTKKFLELVKTLFVSHSLAIPAEKRQMLEILFSNRLISRKNVELEPVFWLERTSKWCAFHVGPHSHDNSRKGQDVPILERDDLIELFRSQDWIRLVELHDQIQARNRVEDLPETQHPVSYDQAA